MNPEDQQESLMREVKSDPLDASFAGAEEIAELRAGMADLKARLDGAAVAAARPVLEGATARATRPEVKQFVDQYLRRGILARVETKAVPTRRGRSARCNISPPASTAISRRPSPRTSSSISSSRCARPIGRARCS